MGAYNTLGDMNFKGKRVLLRVDINCPMDKKTLKIINDVRIRAVIPTIRELLGKKAKLVILAHQSRKGKWDFTDLSQHAQLLSKNLNTPVRYVNDVLGEEAKKAIQEVKEGEVLLLGNVRELDSESKSLPMEEHAKGELVTALAPLFDVYVCDAFGAAHRSQCSLVGFDDVLPSASGRLMAKEMYALETIFNNPRRPSVFILGGAKFGDVPHMIDRVLGSNTADTVIVVGLAGNAFLMARGVDIGEASKVPLQEELTEENFKKAQDVMAKYGQRILLPTDVAVEKDGKRVSVNIGDMATAGAALDIGDQSVEKFRKVLQVSKTSFMSGPAGMFEKDGFEVGTKAIMTAMVESGGLSVLGGGHTSAAAERFDLADSMSYVSTGGGALETFLLKDPLPVIVALEHSKSKFGNGQ
ncbi:phosphoglycerate kinase Pgk [methanogenic archaeon ISO4-H5]|nr:phosphoglycerate kinase Pgk [methanogenic archaeon ISO4-H5]